LGSPVKGKSLARARRGLLKDKIKENYKNKKKIP
jgi:hypothetical protein